MNWKERRAAGNSSAAGKPATPATLADLFSAAVRDHQAGAFANAEQRYRYLLTLFPDHTDSLQNLGLIALQNGDASAAADLIAKAIQINGQVAEYHYNMALACRALGRTEQVATHLEQAIKLRSDHVLAHVNLGNVRREQGRIAEAIACYEHAIVLAPNFAAAELNLANLFLEHRRLDDAFRHLERALALEPKNAGAHASLGAVFAAQGNTHKAIFHYQQALTLRPDYPGAHQALSKAFSAIGDWIPALQAAQRALELHETDETRQSFAQCVRLVSFTSENKTLRGLILRALKEGWARPRDLVRVSISAVKLNTAMTRLVARANQTWPKRLPAEEMLEPSGNASLARDQLLCALLESDLIGDLDLERVLTNVRHAMLAIRHATELVAEELMGFYCGLAQQCFINQYVFATTPEEAEQADQLREALQRALLAEETYPDLWPVIVGAYFPLHRLANSQALLQKSLLQKSWPEAVRKLLVQQVAEPLEEQRIAAALPALTIIGGDVSRAVRELYEENPYPRWVKAGPPFQPAILAQAGPTSARDVLIAGCGTGLSTIELARQANDARILAIDLSLASLSYAKRMAQKFGISNVEFAQADITQFGSMSRTFDFIDASGVLHHLADPWQGWRLLLARLRRGGVMQVGLYSELARQPVVAARAMIAARGYPATPDGIRRCRQDIVASSDPLLRSLTQWADFFSTDECRDLIFHVQEHRVGLPQIQTFLAENDLQFSGFILDASSLQRFEQRFPDPASMLDLECWHRFEVEAPNTFTGMYNFWVRKS